MDNIAIFLQQLREGTLEEGRAYIEAHIAELDDFDTIGKALADEALVRLFSPSLTLKLAELLTFYGEYTRHLPLHALGLKAKGDAFLQSRLHQAALEALDAAGEEFLRLSDRENWARTRISWIISATSLGRVEDALRDAARARAIFEDFNQPYWVCIIDHNTAWTLRHAGRYHEAHTFYERVLTIYPTLTDRDDVFIQRSIAITRQSMAINLSWLGEFTQAYLLQQEALQTYQALEEHDLQINAEIDLALFDYNQGYYGSALRRYHHAQDLLLQYQLDNPKMAAELKIQLANTLVKLNRADEARLLAFEAVEIYRQLGVSLNLIDALREYASILAASSRYKEALVVLDEAQALFTHEGLEHYALAIKLQHAEMHLLTNNFTRAYEDAAALKSLFDMRGLVARSVRASLIMTEALLGQAEQEQEPEQRMLLLQQALVPGKLATLQARKHHLQEEVYRSQSLLGRLLALQGEYTKALRRYRASIKQIEHMLKDLLYDLSPSFLSTAWAVYAETIALYVQLSQNESAFHYLERARSMALRQYLKRSPTHLSLHAEVAAAMPSPELLKNNALIRRTREDLEAWQERYRRQSKLLAELDGDISVSPGLDQDALQAELKQSETKINELFERLYLQQATGQIAPADQQDLPVEAPPLDIAQLQQHLEPGQLLLAYFLQKEYLVVFAVSASGLRTHKIPDGMQQLQRLLPLLHAHLQPGGWPDVHQPPQQPVRLMLRKLYNLLIAPLADVLPEQAGQLIIVPYGPLHTLPFHALYDGSRFLIERFQTSYLPTSNLFAQITSAEHEVSSDAFASPLVFGYSGKGYLLHALDEARTLAQMLKARHYLEEEATIGQLMELAPGSSLIHIATHGHSRLDSPNFSSVTLADGRFSAIDAFSLDLQACELVTLSGCETGLAMSSGGDEQLGLVRAFLAAGAHSLVISLWPVEDHATSQLMQLFYENLLKGLGRAQALCEAQRALIHGANVALTHPYYWAAFRLVGDTRPLTQVEQRDPSSSSPEKQ